MSGDTKWELRHTPSGARGVLSRRGAGEPGKPRRRKSKAAVGAEGAGRNFKVVYGEGTVLRDTIDPKVHFALL